MSIYSDPEFLKRCEAVWKLVAVKNFNEGQKIARGFADLGYEEFLMLPNGKLLSLYSGKSSDLPPEHKHHFFAIPSCDDITKEIFKLADLISIDCVDQRSFKVNFKLISTGEDKSKEASSLELALINVLATCLGE